MGDRSLSLVLVHQSVEAGPTEPVEHLMAVFEHLSQQLRATFGIQVSAESLLIGYGLLFGLTVVGWLLGTILETRRTAPTGLASEYVDPEPEANGVRKYRSGGRDHHDRDLGPEDHHDHERH